MYRGPSGRVRVADDGIDVFERHTGRTRVPWAAIVELRVGVQHTSSGAQRAMTMKLIDGSSLTLPAPVDVHRRAARFDTAAGEILALYKAHGPGATTTGAGEPADEMPLEYRLKVAGQIERGGVPVRRRIGAAHALLFVLFAAGVFGIMGSIHTDKQDLSIYRTYQSAPACTALDSTEDIAASEYCNVSDAVVITTFNEDSPYYSLGVGPVSGLGPTPDPSQWPNPREYSNEQAASFDNDVPALDKLRQGDHVDYVALNGGAVLSVTVNGVTYQTIDGMQQRNEVRDLASILGTSSWTLLFGLWLVLRLTRRRLTAAWTAPLFALAGATLANGAVVGADPTSPLSIGSLIVLTVAVALGAGAALTLLMHRLAAQTSSSWRLQG